MSKLQTLQTAFIAASFEYNKQKRIAFVQNEGGEGYDQNVEAASQTLYAAQKALHEAEFAIEWTAGIFAARRAEWNAAVTATPPQSAREQIILERKLGYTFADIKKAKKLHNVA